ncbi:MAG TPA: response regulator [Anaeromyxobacteraceae bacterium]|nr:response regulator [Anaeromyxobacteraceae bacterium]
MDAGGTRQLGTADKRVLVVDDDRDIRESLVELLESEGYQVSSAANGRDALAEARRTRPDVILLDQMMPVMCGREFQAAQARDPSLAGIPVLRISASPVDSVGEFLRKPFGIDEVLGVVRRLAAGRACAGYAPVP